MEKRPLGRTGLTVSVLGFGTAPIAFLNTDRTIATHMLNKLLDGGMNVIDTATMYTGAESYIGEHLSHRRKDFVLISKCGTEIPEINAPAWSRDLIGQSIERALRLMKTDCIDVMLLHTCDLETLKNGEPLGALLDAKKAGKIKHAGYSGDNNAVAHAASMPEIDVVEMSVNIADQANINLGLAEAKRNNVGVIAKRPIANAAWRDPSEQRGLYKSYSQKYHERLKAMGIAPADLGFTAPQTQAWPEIAIRFCISQPGVSTAVIGTTNPANAEANLSYVKKGPLSTDAVQKIRHAFNRANVNGDWNGLT